jgi:hypothetical protein
VYNSHVFISKGGKAENIGFGVFVGFDHSGACRRVVKTKAIVGVDVIEENQLDIFAYGWLNQRDLEELVGRCGCKDAARTSNSLAWLLHMAFSSGWA